jgi:hypothetical protein
MPANAGQTGRWKGQLERVPFPEIGGEGIKKEMLLVSEVVLSDTPCNPPIPALKRETVTEWHHETQRPQLEGYVVTLVLSAIRL